MIELVHLEKRYGNAVPLADVNAVINDGDVISVIGPSGTGKSTLIRCIDMLERPTGGKIMLDGEPCTCGQKGCWEAYASATALIRQANRAAEAHPESGLAKVKEMNGKAVFDVLATGDAVAMEVVNCYAAYVGIGLVNFINSLYPEVILLGGGVAGAGEALLAPVREYVAANFFVGNRAVMPPIRKAELGNDAGIIGAAALWE